MLTVPLTQGDAEVVSLYRPRPPPQHTPCHWDEVIDGQALGEHYPHRA